MGKIVKFCNSCEEGFAQKFTFCPDCGQTLEAFEMNPLTQETSPVEEIAAAPIAAKEANLLEIPETVQETAPADEIEAIEEPILETAAPLVTEVEWDEKLTAEIPAAAKASAASSSVFIQTTPIDADRKPASFEAEHDAFIRQGQFYVTVIEEKNVKQRNGLLLGSTLLMVTMGLVMTIWSLFNIPLSVYAIGDTNSLASLVDDVAMEVEEEALKKDKDAGGGGGGGGNNDPNPASKGERAPMRTEQQIAPSVTMDRLSNPTIPIQMSIKGPINEYKVNVDRYGVKLGADGLSDGPGSNGGQGGGRNGGQGNNDGPGAGLGNNGGIGGPGNGGMGPGGPGDGGPPPPPKRAAVTEPLKIISKPTAKYTDAARQNNFTGRVLLRITFLASGQIGSVTAVSNLPYGLTDQAIAAARQIRFEPAKRDGVPYTITRTFDYGFNLY